MKKIKFKKFDASAFKSFLSECVGDSSIRSGLPVMIQIKHDRFVVKAHTAPKQSFITHNTLMYTSQFVLTSQLDPSQEVLFPVMSMKTIETGIRDAKKYDECMVEFSYDKLASKNTDKSRRFWLRSDKINPTHNIATKMTIKTPVTRSTIQAGEISLVQFFPDENYKMLMSRTRKIGSITIDDRTRDSMKYYATTYAKRDDAGNVVDHHSITCDLDNHRIVYKSVGSNKFEISLNDLDIVDPNALSTYDVFVNSTFTRLLKKSDQYIIDIREISAMSGRKTYILYVHIDPLNTMIMMTPINMQK